MTAGELQTLAATEAGAGAGAGAVDRRALLLALRLVALALTLSLVGVHLRSLRVFRWEHSVTGGAGAAAALAALGLALCSLAARPGGAALQAWLAAAPAALLALNALALWRRWRSAPQLTRAVAELLGALGVPLRRQLVAKVLLSAAAAAALLADLALAPLTRM